MKKPGERGRQQLFEVVAGGLQTTVQDGGRFKYQATGIPPSGAFDKFSLGMGNLLVGNGVGNPFNGDPGSAALEVTLMGLKLKVLKEAVIAVTGADLTPTLNDEPLPGWETALVRKGDIISFNFPKSGCRAYLCVAGGVEVPLYLGSRSTYVKGSIGGLEGRQLKKGDIIKTGKATVPLDKLVGRKVKRGVIPQYARRQEVRVVLGPQDYLFTDGSLDLFLKAEWRVSPKADRMGYRYIGPRLEFKPVPDYLVKIVGKDPSNIVDDPTIPGSLQWCSTELICLGVDAITLGGFAKPATVITAEVARVGQSTPGDVHVFRAVTVEEALSILEEVESKITEDQVVVT